MKKTNQTLLFALFISILSGLVCDFFYHKSPQQTIQTEKFQRKLNEKETQAAEVLNTLKKIITHSSIDSLINYPFANNDISYYVFEKEELVFWSDNNLDISKTALPDSTDWHYIQLPNAHCVSRLLSFEDTKILALISIKNNYPYENNELNNSFARDFEMDKQIQLVNGKSTDQQAIFCSHGDYLFSLSAPKTPIFDEAWAIMGLFFFSFAFLFFFILYARFPFLVRKKTIVLKHFLLLSIGVGFLIGLALFFNIPSMLFWNKLFTAFQYASNPLLASICHLTIATGYFSATIYLFYFHVEIDSLKTVKSRAMLLIVFALHFILVYYLLSGIIYHSSFQLIVLQLNDLSVLTLWIHFLILLWGIGLALLFYKTHTWFKNKQVLKQALFIDLSISVLLYFGCLLILPTDAVQLSVSFAVLCIAFYLPFLRSKSKNKYEYIACCACAYTAFIMCNALIISNNKKIEKFRIIAQNISINGNTENDRMADILLEELDVQIKNDKKIGRLVSNPDSLSVANEYLNKSYLRGFWNKYDMRLNVAKKNTEIYNVYTEFIANTGTCIKQTHFYNVPTNENNMSYIGEFQTITSEKDSIFFFMEFYPRRNFKSYSFPNLLIASSPDIQTQLNISIAKYEHQKLVYSSGKIEYSQSSNWIPRNKSDFYSLLDNGRKHYVYTPNANTFIVITEQQVHNNIAYLLYFTYTFLANFSVCCIFVWALLLNRRKSKYRLGLTAKFQYAFISLLIISFLLIFYVSVNFIQRKYQEEQVANLESKKNYIQKTLQERYYWNQDLSTQNMQALNFDLQDLSYLYHTDIHVYDNRGVLVGSSQPLIFNKNLISNRISPKPFFAKNANMNQYEHIGKLNYLTAYADFYNGDYLQIGYIAVPQFFSQDEIKNEIESFLAVIIHIYLIIIVLVILVSLFIGKQLSAPLIVLENKLKEMRLGRRNEKIDYTQNDEIGQLVVQYNRTIDELEKSAKLLAQSERETAWKSMARQVAHEINNPLTPMKLSIQQLQRTKKLGDEHFDNYFEKSTSMLIEQIDNLSHIAGTFSDFARMPEAKFERVDIAARLYSVVQLFANNYEQIQTKYQGAEKGVFVYADPEQLVQVFNNLLKNAIQAIPSERIGIIQINLDSSANQVFIKISDNGIGIDNEAYEKLFIPNFTTKTNGMGLGLAIAKNIVELSGGKISVTTQLNEGSSFHISLPKAN